MQSSKHANLSEEGFADERMERLDMTLGVEIECLLVQDLQVETFPDDNPFAAITYGRNVVLEALTQPMQAKCSTCGSLHTFFLPLNPIVHPILHRSNPRRYEKWSVITDATVRLTDEQTQSLPGPDDSTFTHAIEVVSRTMQHGRGLTTTLDDRDPDHMHEISYEEEITAVFAALNAHFNVPHAPCGDAYRLMVNEQCGLHVHVGNGRKSFPFHAIKNLVAMYTANEKQIDGMHAVSRVDGRTLISGKLLSVTPSWKHSNNKPWSAHFVDLEHAVRNGKAKIWGTSFPPAGQQYPNVLFDERPELKEAALSNDLPRRLKLIYEAENLAHLKHLPGNEYLHSTVKLDNLASYEPQGYDRNDSDHLRGKKLTFEFRQHVGTLEPIEALSWVDFLLHLLDFAHDHTEEQIRALCLDIWESPAHDTSDLLKLLGLNEGDPTFKHYQQVTGDHGSAPSWSELYLQQNVNLAEAFPANDRLRKIWRCCIRDSANDREPQQVQQRIREKLLAVCYGQFTKEYLVELQNSGVRFSEKQKERLVLGNQIIDTVEKAEASLLGEVGDIEFDESDPESL
ncbi:hypothetical protein HII31_09205 [Pseudocercospora fuligena]|uniref:Uncharacterized protein n=1 Tax=Pseudocercospora fuligena TaxID=685502 RepID=A0A8H6VFJ7_9PEZI|nr:hypothetical protein HII31_09205 [Pseudocercospora fuligena]